MAQPTTVSPGSEPFNGYSSVGKLFFKVENVRAEFCTASVINSYKPPPKGSMLILTAAHCLEGTFMRLPYIDTHFASRLTGRTDMIRTGYGQSTRFITSTNGWNARSL
jgi:hypothetical protein